MLSLRGIDVVYDDLQVLWGVNLEIARGEIVALLGSNGAGKSTVMNVISGVAPLARGRIHFGGEDITSLTTRERVQRGIAHVLERHRLFPFMTVRENLMLGAYIPRARASVNDALERAFTLFPFLADRQKQLAGSFSGGEQQMLAIGRGLMSGPSLLMLDEPFLGLSPAMVAKIIEVVAELRKQQLTILFIEQHVRHSLNMADRAYVLESGRVALSGDSATLLTNDDIRNVYMGLESASPAP